MLALLILEVRSELRLLSVFKGKGAWRMISKARIHVGDRSSRIMGKPVVVVVWARN